MKNLSITFLFCIGLLLFSQDVQAQEYEEYFTDFSTMGKMVDPAFLDKPDSFEGIGTVLVSWDRNGPMATLVFYSRGEWAFDDENKVTITVDGEKFTTDLIRQNEVITRVRGAGKGLYYVEEFTIVPTTSQLRSMVYADSVTMEIDTHDFSLYDETKDILTVLFEKKGWNN